MYKICKTEQSALRQRELEMVLLKELQQRHFEDISITDLCDGAGVPRKSFYRYFSGKQGALHALLDHTLIDYQSRELDLNGLDGNRERNRMLLFFRFWQNQKPLLDALERSSLWGVLEERMLDVLEQEVVRSKHSTALRTEDVCRLHFAVGGVLTVLHTWYSKGFDTPADQLALMLSQIIAKGFYAG